MKIVLGGKALALTIKNLFSLGTLKGIELLTDEGGANNEITWVNIMEILDELSYLQKGELLLTTGYRLEDRNLNNNLIKMLKSKGLAGIGIQTGYYLDDIPKYIIEDGKKYKFPVFKIPSDLSFSVIMHVVLRNAYNIDIKYEGDSKQNILDSLRKGEYIKSESSIQLAKKLQLSLTSKLCLLLLSIVNIYDMVITESTMISIVNRIRSYFHDNRNSTLIEVSGDKVMFIVACEEEFSAHDLSVDLMEILKDIYKENKNYILTIGASNIFGDVNNLDRAYQEAISSLSTLGKIKVKRGVCFYNHIGIFKTLGLINSDKYVLNLLQEKIEALVEYDKVHNTNYYNTLKAFIDKEFNINYAAQKLYIHRHTLKNRLEKINKLCGIDFNDYYYKLSLSLAIYCHDLFS